MRTCHGPGLACAKAFAGVRTAMLAPMGWCRLVGPLCQELICAG